MQKMDTTTAKAVFEKIIASKRKLTIRDWDSDLFKDDKNEAIKLIEIGALRWDDTKKQIIYVLEEPLGDVKEVEFIKRDSVDLKQKAKDVEGTDIEKGISILCAYTSLKKHQYVDLSCSDDEFINLIWQLFLV